MNDKVKYIITGALAGVANGCLDRAAALFLVPLFVSWLHMEQKKAFATSVAVILPLSVASLAVFFSRAGWTGGWPGPTCWAVWRAACCPACFSKRCRWSGCGGASAC